MPSVKYLQLILMNLTVAGLSSSEFGESSRHRDFADTHLEIPSCRVRGKMSDNLNTTEGYSGLSDTFEANF